MNFLNRALDVFSAALVTPIYYVAFTTLTIVASVVLFREFESVAATELATELCGFLTILGGVFILHATKDADPSARTPSADAPSAEPCSSRTGVIRQSVGKLRRGLLGRGCRQLMATPAAALRSSQRRIHSGSPNRLMLPLLVSLPALSRRCFGSGGKGMCSWRCRHSRGRRQCAGAKRVQSGCTGCHPLERAVSLSSHVQLKCRNTLLAGCCSASRCFWRDH